MGRAPCCDKSSVKKGPWSPEEDAKLKTYIDHHGTGGNWIALPQRIGLKRCGKSCRLRWLNYLRPNLKHGGFSEEEDNIICSLYVNIGSRWSIMAAQLPGRTDNDIKNYWNTKLKKKLLGNQRKEQLQAQAHQVCSMNQEIKRESENWEVISQNPYWPREQSLANYNNVSNIQDYDLNNNQVSSLKSLLTKLGGVKFSYDLQQPYTNMMSSQSSSCDIPSTMNMINSGPITTYFPANTFQEFGNLSNDLSNDLVGCVNSPEIDGSMMQFLCGIESMDVANGSSSMTSTDQSTGWEDINSLVYSPLVSNYQAC